MRRVLLVAVSLLTVACSQQAEVRGTLDKYDEVFALCRQDTDQSGAKPGQHRCSTVASVALERSLADSGLPEAEWRAMLDRWLADSGYGPYYLGPEQRDGM